VTPDRDRCKFVRWPIAGNSCDGGISVLNDCLSWYKFVYTHLYHSKQLYNIHVVDYNTRIAYYKHIA